MFDGNKELKEFVMTLTGSLVFGPNGEITPLSADNHSPLNYPGHDGRRHSKNLSLQRF
ncbi:hypothetical protein ACLB1M_34660 [Escherichia coli]